MKIRRIDEMTKGWFVGNFEPSLIKTNDVEVAVKFYHSGEKEQAHYHKIATEITVVVSGKVHMCGMDLESGDIILLNAGEVTDFLAIEDSVCTVVKYPGASHDKYMEGN